MVITLTHLRTNPEMYIELDTDGIHYASNFERDFEGDFNLLMKCIEANIKEGFDEGFQVYEDRIESIKKLDESASDNSKTNKIAN